MSTAAVLVAPRKGRVELQEQEVGDPGPREVQVRVHRSLVSHGTERAWILARENMVREFPFSPGYATAGVVEAVGKEVTAFREGDRIACPMTHRSLGNISEDALVAKLPDGVSFDEGTFVPLGTVGLQGVRKARIEVTESVMVLGLGLVGQLSVQCAHINGALPVIAVDRVKKRLDIALAGGADVALDNSDESWRKVLAEVTGGEGPQVVIEATGFPEVIGEALETVRKFGRVVLSGSTQGDSTVNFYRDVHCKQVSVIGALNPGNPQLESRPGHWTRRDEVKGVVKRLAEKRINTEALITGRIGVNEILKTYEDILAWKFDNIGTVIEWIR